MLPTGLPWTRAYSPPPAATLVVNDFRPADGFRFGRFLLLPAERQLVADGRPLHTEARAYDLLVTLVERAGQLVTKDELLARIWPGRVVEESNLHVHVSALRKIVGKDAIETISGHGYRFTTPVHGAAARSTQPSDSGQLPRQLGNFIGRSDDLQMLEQLCQRSRLVTLSGMGGAGKTRLAIKLAERAGPLFAQGVRFVDLTSVADPDRVASALATALNVREEGDRPIEETLVRRLADQRMLLVLDNCEHLLDASAKLAARLLESTSSLCILVTSRERLGIAGEHVVPVRPLNLPPVEMALDPDLLSRFEATQLFVERARQIAPQFRINADNASAVVEICRRLDGIPLALELAAARVNLLSVEQIRANLDDRFRLLVGTERAIDRHQSLIASLQSSYEHLSPDEQATLRKLSVFEGGWTLEAAAAIAVQADTIETMTRMGRLVDKSLVQATSADGDGPRFSMLETVRDYARDLFDPAAADAGVDARHTAFFLDLAKSAQASLSGDSMRRWWQRLDAELPNLLAAQSRCDRLPDGENIGLELAINLRGYWLARGLFALGQRVFEEALQRAGGDPRSVLRGKTLYALGQHFYVSGQMGKVIGPLDEAYSIAREHGDHETAVYCLDKLTLTHAWLGDTVRAQEASAEQLVIANLTGNPRLIGFALTALGHACRARDDFDAALDAFEKALSLFESGQDFNNIHNALLHVARASIASGKFDRARETLARAIRLVGEMGTSYRGHFALDACARLAAAQGDFLRAARLQGASDAAMEKVGGKRSWFDDSKLALLRDTAMIALGDDAYSANYAAGRDMDVELALDEAMALLGAGDSAPIPV